MNNIKSLYSSNPDKFIYHEKCIKSYLENTGNTVISTHISPESKCNLKCNYCSVKNRNLINTIELDVIKDYIEKLKTRGLKASIITGGGEPLLYKNINELIRWLNEKELKLGLISNGTMCDNLKIWNVFSWIRISINFENDIYDKINIPYDEINDNCNLGASCVITNDDDKIIKEKLNILNYVYEKYKFKYIRITVDCNKDYKNILINKIKCNLLNTQLIYKNYFLQDKELRPPNTTECHQSYFRPYLSEVDNGSVFPCDSVVLNNSYRKFTEEYILCKPWDILKYIDKNIKQNFKVKNCIKCAFNQNNEFIQSQINNFNEDFYKKEITNDSQYFV